VLTPDLGADEFVPSPFDAYLMSILAPVSGCGLDSTETVTIKIKNVGTSSITSGMMTATYVLNNGTPVTEAVTDTILPNTIYNFSFAATVNLFAPTVDLFFNLLTYVNLTGDIQHANDTVFIVVNSGYEPLPTIVVNDTVPYNNSAVLEANPVVSSDVVFWYSDPLGNNLIAADTNFYYTPVLYDTVTYYVQSVAPGGDYSWTFDNDLEGWTTTAPCASAGGYYWAWNSDGGLGTAFASDPYPTSAQVLTSPAVMIAGNTTVNLSFNHRYATESCCDEGTVWYRKDNGAWQQFVPTVGTYTGSHNIDYNPFNGCVSNSLSSFYGTSGYITSSGDINVTGATFLQIAFLFTTDPSVAATGWFINEVNINSQFGGCGSELVPVTAVVTGVPACDAGCTAVLEPVSGILLSNAEPVTITLINWGTSPISNFSITYEVIETGVQITELLQNTVPNGGILTYTFNTPADLSVVGTYHICAYTSYYCDNYYTNDTSCITVVNAPLVYCVSYSNYDWEEIVNFSIGSFTNYSGPPSGQNYTDFTYLTLPTFNPGVSYPVSITSALSPGYSGSYTCYIELYIDYNHNGIYEEPGEIAFGALSSSTNTVTGTVTIPPSTTSGYAGMRIVYSETSSGASVYPCGTYSYGETEDYFIQIAPPFDYDAAVTAILSPVGAAPQGSTTSVSATIANYGTIAMTAADVIYSLNGAPQDTVQWTGNLAFTQTATVTFPGFVVPAGTYQICVTIVLTGDQNTINNTKCGSGFGVATFSVPYADNFDGTNYWLAGPAVAGSQWQLGTPAYGSTTGAYSAPNAWDVNLTSAYTNSTNITLTSPFFNFTGVGNSKLEVMMKYYTELNYDGTRLEYTTNGINWYLLGTYGDPLATNWYTIASIYSSGQPAWAGTTGGSWVKASRSLAQFANMPLVQFRFVFSSGASVIYDGMSIDNFTIFRYDLGITSIDSPTNGCDMTTEDVTITFHNNGDTVFGGITVSYWLAGGDTITDTISATIAPNANYTHTFATQVDLTSVNPATYTLFASVVYPQDPVLTNNQMSVSIFNGITPPNPSANNVTIWSSATATLVVNNPSLYYSYLWYSDSIPGAYLADGTSYTTPPLFDTTTYYLVQSSGGGGASGSVTTNPGTIGGYTYSGNMFNVICTLAVNIDSIRVNEYYASTVAVYYKTGTYVGYETNSSAWTLLGTQSVPAGQYIMTGLPVLSLAANTTYGFYVTTTTNLGLYNYSSGGYTFTDGTMTITTGNAVQNLFSNPISPRTWDGTIYYSSGGGCASDFVPVTVYTQYAPYDAMVWDITSPTSGAFLTNETVTAIVYNNGLNPISNIPVHYTINGGTPVNETVTATITPSAQYTYTFSTLADLSAFQTYQICVYTTLPNDGYLLNDNYCITVTNINGDGLTCATAWPYEFVNDPAVYGATTFAYDAEWWFVTLLTDYTNIIFSLCGSSYDTYLYIYSDCNGTLLYSNDDYCGLQSQINVGYLSAGTYYVRVAGWSSSYGNYVLNITGTSVSTFSLSVTGTNLTCNSSADGAAELTVTNVAATLPFSYLWSNGETTEDLTGLAAGTYTVTVTDAANESHTASVTISEPASLLASLFGTDVSTLGGDDGAIDNMVMGGTTPYTFLWAPGGETTEDLADLYGGIYQITVTDAHGCVTTEDITINTPNPWSPNPVVTNITHTITIPANADITLDGDPVPPGSWLGVFYHVGNNLVCGGATFWNNMTVDLIAYGNTGTDNGFDAGETFTWKVWIPSPAGDHPGSATYDLSYPQTSTFLSGGHSGITALAAVTIQYQTINLPNGWSIWSTYIIPFTTNYYFPNGSFIPMNNIMQVLSPIAPLDPNPPHCPLPTGQVIIVKNQAGAVYWPQFCLDNIGAVTLGQGYQIKTTQATAFTVAGLACVPEISPITLGSGWYIIGYLRKTAGATLTMLNSLITSNPCPTSPMVTCIIIMKDPAGNVFWPQFCLIGIPNMEPGKGYQIKMSSVSPCTGPYTLLYPPNSVAAASKEEYVNIPSWYNGVENTGNNMTLGIPESAWTVAPETGDEIGVFNQSGELAGASVFQGSTTAIAVWGDDFTTGNDAEGLAISEPFTIKLWHKSSNTEEKLVVTSWLEGNEFFSTDGISVVGKFAPQTSDYTLVQNNPNPFREKTNIRFHIPEDTHVTITLYNVLGDKMAEIVNGNYKAGDYNIVFNANGMAAGTYFYQIVTSNFTATRKMNISK
jgi:hypothetical protein